MSMPHSAPLVSIPSGRLMLEGVRSPFGSLRHAPRFKERGGSAGP